MKLVTSSSHRKSLASVTVTILPGTSKRALRACVEKGATIFRINLSHFDKNKDKRKWHGTIQDIVNLSNGGPVLGVMLDTGGPEFRVNKVSLDDAGSPDDQGHRWIEYDREVDVTLDPGAQTTRKTIALRAPTEAAFGEGGDLIRFCDGEYEARILHVANNGKTIRIQPSGIVRVRKNAKVNLPRTNIENALVIDELERQAFEFFLRELKVKGAVPYLFAQSFVKQARDLDKLDGALETYGVKERIIIAKVETAEAVDEENLESIIERASAIMIARGDLATETSRIEVPQLQRRIITAAKSAGKPVLLATQVYNSLKGADVRQCTRPEAEDVRSALEWGVDGFVLTEEAVVKDPQRVVGALMSQILLDEAQIRSSGHYEDLREPVRVSSHDQYREEVAAGELTIERMRHLGTRDFAIAAVYRANAIGATGIFPFTEHATTVSAMSRFYPETPIYAITRHERTARLLLLYRCTHPILLKVAEKELQRFDARDLKKLVRKLARQLDLLPDQGSSYGFATLAHPPLSPGGTDTLLRVRLDGDERL